MPNCPPFPIELRRRVLVEAGHRCRDPHLSVSIRCALLNGPFLSVPRSLGSFLGARRDTGRQRS